MRIKRIYTSFSYFDYVKVIFFRIIVVVGFYILLRMYNENPALILLLLLLDVIFFFLIGYDKMIICEDRIVLMNMSLFNILFNSKGITYLFDEIQEVKLPEITPLRDIIEVGRFVGLSTWSYRFFIPGKSLVSFYLEMKDGNSIPIYTRFVSGEIIKIVEIVNTLIAEREGRQS